MKYRVSIGMMIRDVDAANPHEAAHICGLGSGDLRRASIEIIDEDAERRPSVVTKLQARVIELEQMVETRDARIGVLQQSSAARNMLTTPNHSTCNHKFTEWNNQYNVCVICQRLFFKIREMVEGDIHMALDNWESEPTADYVNQGRDVRIVGGLEMTASLQHVGKIDEDTAYLRNCPFCGHSGGYYDSYQAGDKFPIGVVCTNTSCGVKTPQHYQTRKLAAAAWNRRNIVSGQLYDTRLKEMSKATVDAKLLGVGFIMILQNNDIEYLPPEAIKIDMEIMNRCRENG